MVRPVPIPNTAVKHCRADGSSPIGSARVGRRHSLIKKPKHFVSAFLFGNPLGFRWQQRTVCVMRIFIPVAAAMVVVLVGCDDSPTRFSTVSTNAPTGGNAGPAPVEYLKSVADAHHSAVKTVDVTSLKKVIDMFNVQEGRLPKKLDELVTRKYLPEIPSPPTGSRIEYDAGTGIVKLVQQ